MDIFKLIKIWHWKNKYFPNSEYEKFISRDVKRTVRIISIDDIENGILLVQMKTNNILYNSKGLTTPSEYGTPVNIEISKLWEWSGGPWGGLPDGTSLGDDSRK